MLKREFVGLARVQVVAVVLLCVSFSSACTHRQRQISAGGVGSLAVISLGGGVLAFDDCDHLACAKGEQEEHAEQVGYYLLGTGVVLALTAGILFWAIPSKLGDEVGKPTPVLDLALPAGWPSSQGASASLD